MDENLQKEIKAVKEEIASGQSALAPAPTIAENPTPAPVASSPTAPPAAHATARKPKLPQKLQVALAVFTLAGGLAAAILPNIAKSMGNTDQPTLLQISLTGIVLILITSILLGYAAQVIGLSKSWLLMAITYNSLIILMKFALSPASLYGQTITLGFLSFDPNDKQVYLLVAGFICLLYLAVFALLYRKHKKRVDKMLATTSGHSPVIKKPLNKNAIIVVIILLSLAFLGTGGLLLAPLFAVLPSANYLQYVFSGAMGLALMVALVFTILTASMSFINADETALKMRDSTILATFFWLGLSMILLYHALWVVFMTIMVSIWPLKTISPSGK